jgi:hypothetical protein
MNLFCAKNDKKRVRGNKAKRQRGNEAKREKAEGSGPFHKQFVEPVAGAEEFTDNF